MKIKSTDLKKAMDLVTFALTTDKDIEQGNSFIFNDNKIITYNNEVAILFPFKNDLDCSIDSTALYSFISKIKECELVMEKKGGELIIKANRSTVGIPISTNESVPKLKKIKNDDLVALPDNFIKAIKFAKDGCGTDMSFPILNCVNIRKKAIESSDGFKVIEYKLSEKQPFEFLLPLIAVNAVIKTKPSYFYLTKSWVYFQSDDGLIVACRILKGEFPPIREIMKVKGNKVVFPESAAEIISKAEIFAKKERKELEEIEIELTKTKFKLSSRGDSGWFKEEVKSKEHKGKDIKFTLPPYLLKDILSKTSVCIISDRKINFSDKDWNYTGLMKATTDE